MTITVLIVDDHSAFRARARRLLEAEGYRVVGEAADGAEGVAAALRLAPDLVLLDLQLPDASGFAIAAEITGADSPPAVVITSTRDAADFGELAERNGARGFVSKSELTITRIAHAGDPVFVGYLRDITERHDTEAELRASRARIVKAGWEVRRRIERDLHDGVQQHLVGLALLDEAIADLAQATTELREFARGIHPAVLTEGG